MEAVGCAILLLAASSSYWQLASAIASADILLLRASHPCPLCKYIYFSLFLSPFNMCICWPTAFFIFFSPQTRKKCIQFSCVVYKMEKKQKIMKEEKKKPKPHDLIYFILILVFLFKYFFRAVNFFPAKDDKFSFVHFKLSFKYLNINLAVSLRHPIPRLL